MSDNFATGLFAKLSKAPTPNRNTVVSPSAIFLYNLINPDCGNDRTGVLLSTFLKCGAADLPDAKKTEYDFLASYTYAIIKLSGGTEAAAAFDEYKIYDDYLASALDLFVNREVYTGGKSTLLETDAPFLAKLAITGLKQYSRALGMARADIIVRLTRRDME